MIRQYCTHAFGQYKKIVVALAVLLATIAAGYTVLKPGKYTGSPEVITKVVSQKFKDECGSNYWEYKCYPDKTVDAIVNELGTDKYWKIEKMENVEVLDIKGKLVKGSAPNRCCGADYTVHVLIPAEYNGSTGTLDIYCYWSTVGPQCFPDLNEIKEMNT